MAKQADSPARDVATEDSAQGAATQPAAPWRSGFFSPLGSLQLAAQRLGKSWRLLLAVELGMVVAVALLATAPFYSDLVSSAQLQNTLTNALSTDRNIQVDTTIPELPGAIPSSVDSLVNSDVNNGVGSLISSSTEYVDLTQPLTLTSVNGKAIAKELPGYPLRAGPQDLGEALNYAQALPHMKLFSGRLPKDTAAHVMPEVLVTPAFGVKPGTVLHFADSQDAKFNFDARVVGVWFPKDESDPFWNGHAFDTIIAPNISNPPPPQYPVLFTRNTLIETFAAKPPVGPNPVMGLNLHYIYFTAVDRITVNNASALETNLTQLRGALDADVPGSYGAQQVDMGTHLGQIVAGVIGVLGNETLPLYSIDAQLVALALLFIFVMAGLLVESQAGEIATLKSRGASLTQVLLTYLTQGLLLAAIAVVAGVALAEGLALTLLRTFVPLTPSVRATLTPAYVARFITPQDASRPALIGAGLGLLALALAAWQAARSDALAFRREQGRSQRVPFWKRYYLDLGLAVLCIAGYLELATFGGFTTRAQLNSQSGAASGVGQASVIQLLAPTLMLLAGALLLQRVLPWLVAAGAWLATRRRGAVGMLAFSQVSRASATFSRLTLLLTLAVGLGLFALSFQTTIARGAQDDAAYLTGADERVDIMPQSEGTQSTLGYAAKFAQMPGVQSVTALYHGVALTLPNQGGQNVDILGVDPDTFAQTAIWRSDYATQTLPALMQTLARATHGANAGASSQPIVALIDQDYANNYQLSVGQRFQLVPQEAGEASVATSAYFVVGGIVNAFPSLYDQYGTGYVVVDLNDYLAALQNPNIASYTVNGPNQFLLRTSADPTTAVQRARALTDPNFFVQETFDARALATTYRADPVAAGMSGLLLLGALIAALLALVGVLTQAGLAARQRQTQFAILRTLGLDSSAMVGILLSEQALVYGLGALGGVAIGALLAVASLPFLGFSTSTYTPPVIGVPTSQLAFNLPGSLIYLGVLLVVFVLALILAGVLAQRAGLGQALRVGED